MKLIIKISIIFLLLAFCLPAQAQKNKKKSKKNKETVETEALITHLDSVSYAFGVVLGHNLKAEKVNDLDLEKLLKGIGDVLKKDSILIPAIDSRDVVNMHIDAKRKEIAKANEVAGKEYLELNKVREGVKVLPSGLQYEILVDGEGDIPQGNNKVLTHYHGTLVDGTVFDSSVERGEPITFPVTGVIKGWTEALKLMPVGSKWRLVIPSDLAYGEHGAGKLIGPNSVLIFEIELLEITE